jgi:hypothetical protein
MTDLEKTQAVTRMTGETNPDVLSTYLNLAAEKILKKCYPFKPSEKTVPERYSMTHVEITVFLLNKRGAEGQKIHNEGGIHRHYEDGDVPDSMLASVVPFASPF